ncbi:copper transporter [Cellulosimicrobium funkei]|uniref:copper transporter n=1 Tax=Cellulosimicrobium funkei TaxID=264251 RepID=UPI0037577F6F
MIDFRYHIVSLISVFLALAVGIILGAGPLQGAIGDQLTGQVEQLRTERNELRDQLDQANVTLGDDARYIEAAGPQLVAGSLQDRRVAVVDLDGADDERDDAIAAQLETAGASVVGHVRLTDSWTSQDEESARQTVAEGLGDKLGDVPQDATPEQRLSRALALSLTGAAPSSTEERSPEALELEALLERFALVDVVSEQTLPADVVLLLGGSAPLSATPAAEGEEPPAPDTYAVDIEVQVAVAAQEVAGAALVAGPTAVSGDVVSTIRANEDLASTVSTVSGIEAEPGRINVPLALAARLADQVGQFGFEENATAVLPPAVELPAVTRTTASPAGAQDAAAQLVLLTPPDRPDVAAPIEAATRAAAATWLVRDLANTPSDVKDPAWFADRALALADGLGLDTTVRGPAELAGEGFGALLAVGAGSARGPRLVTVTYDPADHGVTPPTDRSAPRHVVVVGKGITYDTGGLSIKPREAMVPMKTDMAGAAVALAVVLGAARARSDRRVTAVLPLAENHVGAASYRPGDVLRTWSGRTVEVANTDAEGRLVLADAVGYAVQELAPDVLVDVATLTGAASVGLGRGHGALFATDDAVADALEDAARTTGERVWRMPLVEDYAGALRSDVADLRHVPVESPGGGAITAALFLREFVGDVPWAHLDVAGPARATADRHEVVAGATGFGARLLLEALDRL